jgi:SAM-dependent methyltransferase
MKLSELVYFLNHLESYNTSQPRVRVEETLAPILHSVKSREIQFNDLAQQLDQRYNTVLEDIQRFLATLQDVKQQIQECIRSIEPKYLAQSYYLYDQEMVHDSDEHVLNRRLNLTPEADSFVSGRINLYGDWKYPGMIIRPGMERWISSLVSLDPLYVVDTKHDLLLPAMLMFNESYQRRLRPYVITESTESTMLDRLPNGQFGFILVYNYFHYKPLELIKCMLIELYQKLRPGGTVAFTFNNCDRSGAVALCERSFMCYTPGQLLLPMAESIGYQIKITYDVDAACTWIEMCKPGKLDSLRGGQTLAKLVHKTPGLVDNQEPVLYTDEEIESLRQQAINLNIDTRENILSSYYQPSLLKKLIKKRMKQK